MTWLPKYNHRHFMQWLAFCGMGIATAASFWGYAYLRQNNIVSKEDPSTFGICVLMANAFVEMAKKIWRIDTTVTSDRRTTETSKVDSEGE